MKLFTLTSSATDKALIDYISVGILQHYLGDRSIMDLSIATLLLLLLHCKYYYAFPQGCKCLHSQKLISQVLIEM